MTPLIVKDQLWAGMLANIRAALGLHIGDSFEELVKKATLLETNVVKSQSVCANTESRSTTKRDL